MKAPILVLAFAAALGAITSGASASSTFHASSDETGSTMHVVPGTLTKTERETLDRIELANADPNWVYRGEEAGWELRPHSYEIRRGRLAHTDRIPHDTPKPAAGTQADAALYRQLERD